MATRGVWQLSKLKLYYCEQGGSSRAMRDFLATGPLVRWARQNPQIEIEVIRRNGKHPYIHGEYISSPASTMHQITVKNVESWRDVQAVCDMLRNRSGRKIKPFTKPVITDTPSIQGIWTPFLNLHTQPNFRVQVISSDNGPEDGSSSDNQTHP